MKMKLLVKLIQFWNKKRKMYNNNKKKNSRIRRLRAKRDEPQSSLVKVITKSQGGVEYTHYKVVHKPGPIGHNRADLRAMLAKNKMRKIDYK